MPLRNAALVADFRIEKFAHQAKVFLPALAGRVEYLVEFRGGIRIVNRGSGSATLWPLDWPSCPSTLTVEKRVTKQFGSVFRVKKSKFIEVGLSEGPNVEIERADPKHPAK